MPALPIIAVAATVAATAVAAGAAVQQSEAQQAASKYNQQMENYDASIQQQQGQQNALAIEQQGEIIQGKARAAAAASGLSGGSSIDIQYNDLLVNDESALEAKYRGTIGAYNATSQAGLDSMAASNEQSAGIFGAGGALLSGASKAYGQYNSAYGTPTTSGIFGNTTSSNGPGF